MGRRQFVGWAAAAAVGTACQGRPPPDADRGDYSILWPDRGALTQAAWLAPYLDAVRRLLLPRGGALTMVVLPSFQNEYAVALEVDPRDASGARVESRRAAASIWSWATSHARDGRLRPEHRDIDVEVAAIEVAPATATSLIAAWRSMLRRTRPRRGGSGLDGTRYHFGDRAWSGHTWSPDPDSLAGTLASLGDDLAVLPFRVLDTRAPLEAELRARADALAARAATDGRRS